MPRRAVVGLAVLVAILVAGPSQATPMLYYGIDKKTDWTLPHPNADAAAAAFESTVGAFSAIDFEDWEVGLFTSRSQDGVTIELGNVSPDYGGIQDTPRANTCGYNTTPGGQQWLQLGKSNFSYYEDSIAELSFPTPIWAFGAYFTGVGDENAYGVHLFFDDGSAQELAIAGDPYPNCLFYGFADPGKRISQMTLFVYWPIVDVYGVDDIHLSSSPVPEPASLALLACAIGGIGAMLRKRRKR